MLFRSLRFAQVGFCLDEVGIDVRQHADHAVQLGLRGGELGLRFDELDLGGVVFRDGLVRASPVEACLFAEGFQFVLGTNGYIPPGRSTMSQALGQAQGIGNKIESLTPESLHLRMGSKLTRKIKNMTVSHIQNH